MAKSTDVFVIGGGPAGLAAAIAARQQGFRVIVAESYAEIFFGNCTTLGIPCFSASRADIQRIAAAVERDPRLDLVADVDGSEIHFGGQTVKASIRESARDALVNGRWDAIGDLLEGVGDVKRLAARLPYLAA